MSDGLKAYHLYIFIDGLDEFYDNQAIILDLIKSLKNMVRLKFCLLNRPYPSFRDELGSAAMLRLQDLTEPDTKRYVLYELDPARLKASQIRCSPIKLDRTVETIVKKAKGVFLWVTLALRDQIEGISNGDGPE